MASYEGRVRGDSLIGHFGQMGKTFPLNLGRGNIVRNRPQTPQPPFPYTTEDVTFPSGDHTLAGTLSLSDATAETPAVLLVSGSGPQNRDEELMGHKPFAVIADAFARAGIATLRYDDRGTAESTGDYAAATTAKAAPSPSCSPAPPIRPKRPARTTSSAWPGWPTGATARSYGRRLPCWRPPVSPAPSRKSPSGRP